MIFSIFKGNWDFTREIRDADTHLLKAQARGTATFETVDTQTLKYHEEGTLDLAEGHAVSFFRTYFYKEQEGAVHVYYGDGPDMNKIYHIYTARTATAWHATEDHLCGPDRYSGSYTLRDPDHYTMTQKVVGPRKNEEITTFYHRKPLAPPHQ